MVCICLTLWVAGEIGEFEGGIGVAVGLFEGFATCPAFVGLNFCKPLFCMALSIPAACVTKMKLLVSVDEGDIGVHRFTHSWRAEHSSTG